MAAACSRNQPETPPAADVPPADAAPRDHAPAAELPALMGTAWSAEFIDGKGETHNRESTLEFLPEGRVAGRAGCNRYGGPVEVSGNEVRFGSLMATKMACDILDQEQKFLDALAATRNYKVENGRLVLVDEAGTERARLVSTVAAAP